MARVEIRPIVRQKWHGKTGKEDFSRPQTIGALVNPLTQKYVSGLTEDDRAWLEEQGINYDLSENYTDGSAHPFWDDRVSKIALENNTMIFDTSIPIQRIKVAICRGSQYVASSVKELEEGKFPEATHVIFDEQADVEARASKVQIKNQATIALSKIGTGRKKQIAMILAGKNLTGKSEDHVAVVMDDILSRDPKAILRLIEQDTEETKVHAIVLDCLQKHVLTKKGHKIFYFDANLGGDVSDVVRYLQQPDNQELLITLTQKLEV